MPHIEKPVEIQLSLGNPVYRGADGLPGKDGAPGRDGATGKSAYEVAVDNGFVGTVAEWLESLKGQDGIIGKDGADGKDGKDGVNGKDGADGKDGKDGADGYTPVKGVDYFTQSDINSIISQIPAPDLTGYATTTYVDTSVAGVQGLPTASATDGTYLLKCVVSSGSPAYSWESVSIGGSY